MNWVKRIIDIFIKCVLGKSEDKSTETHNTVNIPIGNSNTIINDNSVTHNDNRKTVVQQHIHEQEYKPSEFDYAIRKLLLEKGEIYCTNLRGSLSFEYKNWQIESSVERLVRLGIVKYLDASGFDGRITKGPKFYEICIK